MLRAGGRAGRMRFASDGRHLDCTPAGVNTAAQTEHAGMCGGQRHRHQSAGRGTRDSRGQGRRVTDACVGASACLAAYNVYHVKNWGSEGLF
eukprot:356093-Chlamydomonas_euryale.AAC.6